MFREAFDQISNIFKWRMIIAVVLLLFLSCNIYIYGQGLTENISFWDLILLQTNNNNNICFAFLFIILFINGDFLINNNSKRFLKKTAKWEKAQYVLLACIFMSVVVILSFFIINVLVYIILAFSNYDFLSINIIYTYRPAYIYVIHSFLLITLRILSITLFIYILNTATNTYYFGSIVVMLLSFIDFNFYYITDINNATMLMPIDNTLVSYDSLGLLNPIRNNFFISYIYWIFIISILYYFITFLLKKQLKNGGSSSEL